MFRTREFLLKHIRHTMAFYDPISVDPAGGFYHYYMDDGSVYDKESRHLVSSTRFVFNNAMAWLEFGEKEYQARVRHGIDFIRKVHFNPLSGGYAWEVKNGEVTDATNQCYGLAFLMLAYACAYRSGMDEAKVWLDETYDTMEQHFWLPEYGVYASEASSDWVLDDYRGQNDNMHGCEAMLAAFEATGEIRYLDRAKLLAANFTQRQAALTEGAIWEHFRTDWTPNLQYNKGNKTNIFRPWGIQTGHQTEWAKLLLILDRHDPQPWHLARARELFETAMSSGWDEAHGGLIYGYDLDGEPYDQDKYFWVQAESLAAAALLADRTRDEKYWQAYDKIWTYSWEHFVDHQHGAWYRVLSPDNQKIDQHKSPAGKTDYHTMGACHEVLKVVD